MGSASAFDEHRSLLFTIAYEITGTVTDAEDVLQESYLRWSAVDSDRIGNQRAYLAKTVTRQALNSLRTSQRRREDYIGPWLPEPVVTLPDVAEDAVLADSLSFAMLVVLESLSPEERAVFVLREVFDFPYSEIAEATGKTLPAVRQLAHRAKEHVEARQPRFEVDAQRQKAVTERFIAATLGGDLQTLMDVLAPGAVLLSDGGGKASAARRPVIGADHVARFLLGIAGKPIPDMRVEMSSLNGMPAILIYSGDKVDLAVMVESSNDHVTGLYLVRNPDKLGAAATTRQVSR
ncbi:RNA polymerase sigma-70 factor (ECF subfamily) [Arthrobacter sp. SLBN-112]|jgi:RNA polymerase sigma-70 factor (ECF subfamily)|uniref:RNA polymerase sigma-70 factor n=1 Tax=Arthrobacter sp. SLBN-112 TaxID=2768452 RepID=UPI0011523B1C|nr:RNA polymerase sigma-70 factor [Arthrobacter sp. SLBN-112]TQJ39143.1 RNA polymerase sigma-70 factor (ECF subfamily) [Arthrobacter sp. SLBN-112]